MTKGEAVAEILHDSKQARLSKTSLKRVRKACAVLGLAPDEVTDVLRWLDYADAEGKVFQHYQ